MVMNNPFQMLGAMNNPQAFLNMMLQNSDVMQDARAKKAYDLLQRGDTRGLQSMAENLCKEYGTTPDEVRRRLSNIRF